MLKWTTRGSLNISNSSHGQLSMGEQATTHAQPSVITPLAKVSSPDPVNNDNAGLYHFQPQGKQKTHGGSGRHSSGALMAASPPPERRTFLPRLKRSSSLSRGDRGAVEGQRLRYASSRSLPSSPQTAHSGPDDSQKKTGVMGMFKKLFRTSKSANKVYQVDSATAGKFSPGPARRRSRSPVKEEYSGSVKGLSSSKTRLTRLIAAKRGERKQTRSNFSIQKSVVPQKSESISSAEEHPYVQHSQVDKTLFLRDESSLASAAPESTGSDWPPPRFRQNQHRQSAAVNAAALSRAMRFSELGASVQSRQGQMACLQRSSSLRSPMDAHSFKFSKAGGFDQRSPNISLQNPQRRRWSSQSTNIALRSNETECQPASSKLPRPESRLMFQLANKQACSDDSLFQFGESLMTVLELGSINKVKVMPSHPDIIIQARKSLSPVCKNSPLDSPQDEAITARATRPDLKDKFMWSVTDDGAMLITSTTDSCKPDTINHKQAEFVTHTDISWPRNNNNGRGKTYGNTNIPHTGQETSDAFLKMCKEDRIHDEQRRGCAVTDEDDNTVLVSTKHNKMGVSYDSPLSSPVGTDNKCEVSRVRVRDIVKSIEEQFETVSKRSVADYPQAVLAFDEGPEEADLDSHRTTDDGHGSDSTAAIPSGWVQETGQDVQNKGNDINATSPVVLRKHNYSPCESEGFSPKACISVSEEARSSVHIPLPGGAVAHDDSNMQSPNESEICESSGGNRSFSSASPQSSCTPSIPSDMINDTWTFPWDVQAVFSDSSNVDSLVRNIALTNKAAKSAARASTASQSDRICDQFNETDASPVAKQQCKKVVGNEKLTKCEHTADDSECEDSTGDSLTSHGQRVDVSPLSRLLFTNNHEEGITDIRAPVNMVLQDSSLLEATENSTVDALGEQLAGEIRHQQLNTSSIEIISEASIILSPDAETHILISSSSTQKSPDFGHLEHAHFTTSEMEQQESMISIKSVCEHSGFLETTHFKLKQEEPDNCTHLKRGQRKSQQSQHLYEGETQLLTPACLQQGQASLVISTFGQETTLNCARAQPESVEPLAMLKWRAQGSDSSSSQTENIEHSGDDNSGFGSQDSRTETKQVHGQGESLKQTNGWLGETALLEPRQQSKHVQFTQSTSKFSGKLDCRNSKDLLGESLIPSSLQCGNVDIPTSTNILSGTDECLLSTNSPDALVPSPGGATECGSRCGESKHSPTVKPKKKVSFNLGTSQQDSMSSASDVAVIEVVPRMKTTADYQQTRTEAAGHDPGQVDTVSSTDVSCSFSLQSNDGPGLTQQATSTSGDDLTWWGPDVAVDIDFFHDVIDEKCVKDTAAPRVFEATQQTANLELTTRHDSVHGAASNSSSASLSEKVVKVAAGARQPNKLINKANDIFTWLHSGVTESTLEASTHTITDKKRDDNKDANSTLAANRDSDKHIQEESQQHMPVSCTRTPKEPSKYQEGSTPRAGADITNQGKHVLPAVADITNQGEHVHPAGVDITNQDEHVLPAVADITNQGEHEHLADSSISNEDRSVHRTDSDMTNEDDNTSSSDTKSRTYDVYDSHVQYKKITNPWWEEAVTSAAGDLDAENVASTIERSRKVSARFNSQGAVPRASCLSHCFPQSPLRGPTIHADKKQSDKDRALTVNHTSQNLCGKGPSRKSPDIYFKQGSEQNNPSKHGDIGTEPTTTAAFVQPLSFGESKRYSGRSCMKTLSPGKRQASSMEKRRPFVLANLCNKSAEVAIVKASNDDIKTSCVGEKMCVFDFSSPSKSDNPASDRTSWSGYSSQAQGAYEVVAIRTRTSKTGSNKKQQPRRVSSPENATSGSDLLAGHTAQSASSTRTRHDSASTHTARQPGLEHCWKPGQLQSCQVTNALQQPCALGRNHHTFVEVTISPAQTNLPSCDQHVPLVASKPVLVSASNACAADNRHTIPDQTTTYSPRMQPKSNGPEILHCFNCACDTGHGGGMDSKKKHRKKPKYKYEFGCNGQTCDRSKYSDGLFAPYVPHEHLAEGTSSESETLGRPEESPSLSQPHRQCSPNYSTCSLRTKYLYRQRPSDTGRAISHTELDYISRPNSSTSQHNQGGWSHSSESARNYTVQPNAATSRYIRKTSLSGSRWPHTNTARSDPPKPWHCKTHWSSSRASPHTHDGWLDTSHAQSSSRGRGQSFSTQRCRLDSQPGQWMFIATFFVFQLFLHWLYVR